jgi:hypothetical protein
MILSNTRLTFDVYEAHTVMSNRNKVILLKLVCPSMKKLPLSFNHLTTKHLLFLLATSN